MTKTVSAQFCAVWEREKKTPIFEVQETFESIWNPSLLDGRFGPFSRAVENKTIAIFLRQEVNPTAITEKEAPS